jgi:quinolinate synthase
MTKESKMATNKKLIDRIAKLKKEKNAVILAHNYQLGEVQDVADHVGDSLDLSRKAAATSADVIVFAGVHFMAETAKILSPKKTVLLPSLHAGCPMADMVDADSLIAKKKQHPDAVVVTYVNSTAEVKAYSDICCTSANAVKVVESIPRDKKIIFVPDQYLGGYVQDQTGREMILWPGYCPTHKRITLEQIEQKRKQFPDAKLVVHPECRLEVSKAADVVASTSGIIRFAGESDAKQFIIGTELGIIHRLQKENPDKVFIPISEQAVCPNMKRTELETLVESMEKMQHRIELDEEIRKKAENAVLRMLEIG